MAVVTPFRLTAALGVKLWGMKYLMTDGKKSVNEPVDSKTEESMKIHQDILVRVIQWLMLFQQDKYSSVDPVIFARMVVTSFNQYAAMVAVDLGMSEKQFVDVCRANFQDSYEKAPKWG